MKNKWKKVTIAFAAFAVVILISVFYFMNKDEASVRMDYVEFSQHMDKGQIEEAVISGEEVTFKLKNDNAVYVTDNPDYDSFKEKLLLSGAKVSEDAGGIDIFYIVMDIIFDIIFVGILVAAVYIFLVKFRGQFKVIKRVDASFDDIAGMDKLKTDMKQLAGLLKSPDEYRKKGVRQPKGVLLVGPPGNGKTLFARALAGEAGMNFIATKATDFQSMYMSIGPAKIKTLFKKARKSKPCIVFIDEFDGIGEARNYAGQAIDKENNRMITALLNELDGFEQNGDGILVIGATNEIDNLDPALIRPGRFDRKYRIDNPDNDTIIKLVDMYMSGREFESGEVKNAFIRFMKDRSCAEIETIINEALMAADRASSGCVRESDIREALHISHGDKIRHGDSVN